MSALALLTLLALTGVNTAAFAAMAVDKQAAIDRHPRIPERTLLLLALFGGAAGAVAGQQTLRHKTRKEPFRSLLWAIALAQLALAVWLGVIRAR